MPTNEETPPQDVSHEHALCSYDVPCRRCIEDEGFYAGIETMSELEEDDIEEIADSDFSDSDEEPSDEEPPLAASNEATLATCELQPR